MSGDRLTGDTASGGFADLDAIRQAAAAVSARARHVRIAREKVEPYAAELARLDLAPPALDPQSHFLGRGEQTVAFMLALEAVNFGSGTFRELPLPPGESGYFAVAGALCERFREAPLGARELAALDRGACSEIFARLGTSAPARELLGLFAESLRGLGLFVGERFGGSFTALVESAGGSAEQLVRILATVPGFDDVAWYDGERIPFYKRAQLAAADLSLAFGGEGPGSFHDLDRLTIFADNQVPHVLREDGLLVYEPELAAAIAAGRLLPAGSPEEVEIRAAAIHAAELLVEALRAAGHGVCAMQVDYLLWNRGLGPSYRAKPTHRTLSRYY